MVSRINKHYLLHILLAFIDFDIYLALHPAGGRLFSSARPSSGLGIRLEGSRKSRPNKAGESTDHSALSLRLSAQPDSNLEVSSSLTNQTITRY
jgi:hypothetical protein